MFQVKKVN